MRICRFLLLLMFTCLVFENFVGAIHELPLLLGGDVPLITDDTGTPGHNKWEINLGYTRFDTIDERAIGFIVDANYGLGERTQLNLVIPHTSTDHDEDGEDNGLGDIQFGTKYRFIDEADWFLSISATPTIFIPTGNERTNPDFFLPLEFDRHFKSLYIGSQVGYLIHGEKDENDELFYGFFAEHPVFKRIDVVGEIFGFLTKHEEVNSPHFNGGLRYRFSDLFSVMGSAGRSFEGGSSSSEPDFLGYIGVRLEF
ncbi:MAG: transporter [Candidatus Brocadiales bacterium]